MGSGDILSGVSPGFSLLFWVCKMPIYKGLQKWQKISYDYIKLDCTLSTGYSTLLVLAGIRARQLNGKQNE